MRAPGVSGLHCDPAQLKHGLHGEESGEERRRQVTRPGKPGAVGLSYLWAVTGRGKTVGRGGSRSHVRFNTAFQQLCGGRLGGERGRRQGHQCQAVPLVQVTKTEAGDRERGNKSTQCRNMVSYHRLKFPCWSHGLQGRTSVVGSLDALGGQRRPEELYFILVLVRPPAGGECYDLPNRPPERCRNCAAELEGCGLRLGVFASWQESRSGRVMEAALVSVLVSPSDFWC